ncbi:unnamed protein product [Polarella glacialis]|uniref:Cytosine-specific methyltransferase n=1 Tax=Polarella glacialis TaxID=89957 RepID=A0A813I1V3_POLGL|nr:unnamed protein product [Polarella glacialis]
MSGVPGLPVGALIVREQDTSLCQKLLKKANWLKPGVSITKYAGDLLSPAHSPTEQTAGGESLPPPRRALHLSQVIATLLADGAAAWAPGLRVRSSACRDPFECARPAPSSPQSPQEGTSQTLLTPQPALPAFTFSELFAGIGGFRVALDKLGGRCIFASELSGEAQSVYAANFGDMPHGDITEVEADEIGSHDLLTAGFPCQPFSALGEQDGFADPRGLLFMEIVRVLHACHPRAFILENVHNLLYIDGGRAFAEIVDALSNAGYDVDWRLINSRIVLPQQRVRVYIVGLRVDAREESFPFRWPELPILDAVLSEVLEGQDADADPRFLLSDSQYEKLLQSTAYKSDPQKSLARIDGVARTLTSSYRGGHRSEYVLRPDATRPRFYTLRECARLQGFPEYLAVAGNGALANPHRAYHQLGNAVCPVIIAAIAAAVLVAVGRPPVSVTHADLSPCADKPQRGLVAHALELLIAASPAPDAETDGRPSLRSLCSAFLLGAPDGPLACTGRGAALSADDLELLRSQLTSGQASAQLGALFTIGRVVHLEAQAQSPSKCSALIVAAELLPVVVDCLSSPCFEVRRTAVLALQILSRTDAAQQLAATSSIVARVQQLAESADSDASGARMGQDILCSIQVAHNGLIAAHPGKMEAIREGKADILVATDIAARGLDVPNVTHVVNYELPMVIDEFVHRCGRTGRIGKSGTAVTFVTGRESVFLAVRRTILQQGHWIPPWFSLQGLQLSWRPRNYRMPFEPMPVGLAKDASYDERRAFMEKHRDREKRIKGTIMAKAAELEGAPIPRRRGGRRDDEEDDQASEDDEGEEDVLENYESPLRTLR